VVALLKGKSGAAYKITVSYAMQRPYCLYFAAYGTEGSFESGRTDQSEVFYQVEYDTGSLLVCANWTRHIVITPISISPAATERASTTCCSTS